MDQWLVISKDSGPNRADKLMPPVPPQKVHVAALIGSDCVDRIRLQAKRTASLRKVWSEQRLTNANSDPTWSEHQVLAANPVVSSPQVQKITQHVANRVAVH